MLDLIGDIHGHAEPLVRLLTELGYQRHGLGFRHPSRQAIFIGVFIDRGPAIAKVYENAWAIVEAGTAQMI